MTKAELNEKYGHILGLRDINIEIPSGRIQVIMGLSGSGKSTLIRHINRLIDPTAGEVLVDGIDVSVLLDIQKEIKKTIVFITHDLDEALRLGDQIAILRDGEIIQQGTSQDIVLRPADDYVANFVKEVNRGRVIQVEAVMRPFMADGLVTDLKIAAESTVEDAVRLLAPAPEGDYMVTSTDGRALGLVNLRELAAAMVNSQPLEHSGAVY
eukprot:gene17303-17493_t